MARANAVVQPQILLKNGRRARKLPRRALDSIPAERPHVVHMVNQGFKEMFDLASSQALGCPLHRVHGADEEDWAALLGGARGGSQQPPRPEGRPPRGLCPRPRVPTF